MGSSLYYICYIWLVCNLLVKNVFWFFGKGKIHADDERSLKNLCIKYDTVGFNR